MSQGLAALSIDLDELRFYAAIHGLGADSGVVDGAVYRLAVPRLRRLLDELQIRATFFVVGADIARESSTLAQLVADGHELGNHSFDHHYDLTRRPRLEIHEQIATTGAALEAVSGARPVGFRAPGYRVTDELFDVLLAQGYRYDSSVFPSPPYFLAKAAAIGAHRLFGRVSRSVQDDPRLLLAPADPYRVGNPYWRRGRGLLELPIGVTRGIRAPYIGTSLALAGRPLGLLLTWAITRRPLVNLELHGIDFLDRRDAGLGPLASMQPDLRVARPRKERALRSAVDRLQRAGYRFVRLIEAAEAFVDGRPSAATRARQAGPFEQPLP